MEDSKSILTFLLNRPLTYHVKQWQKLSSLTSISKKIFFYRFLLNDFKSFNSLSKVLFIFPSQYLFAIGFP